MSSFVTKRMTEREEEFTEVQTIRLITGTYNVNGQFAPDNLSVWLNPDYEPDIYAIGFQELDLSPEAYLLYDGTKEIEWTHAILLGLGEKANKYYKLVSKQLIGILLMIFVKKEQLPNIKDVQTDSVGVGMLGVMGNKGAVAARLRFRDSYLCFVCCHLAADPGQLARRNQDYLEICRRLGFSINTMASFPSPYSWVAANLPVPAAAAAMAGVGGMITGRGKDNAGLVSIFDSDHLIWMGDLNYRIETLPESEVKSMLENDEMQLLLNFDQLNIQRRAKLAFNEFEEGSITFPPTYKYDIGKTIYDTSEKRRSPAWTDRILWRSKQNDFIKQIYYKDHMEIVASDHKPVSAAFEMKVKIIHPDKQANVHSSVVREWDKLENERIPDVAVSTNQVDFGKLTPDMLPKSEILMIENIGKVPAKFTFIPKFGEASVSQSWLNVEPVNGEISSGNKQDIKLTVQSTTDELKFEDILILHIEHGKDHFITVTGEQ
ncbi:2030_t:CDS:10 [Paraglomus occultum]|uniref:2030_t:CDS:1 n=1 Tax=Paraglomus occultum TaxID=144539 RepID=A0A9N9GER3_9GLOM|nr:2030_t:CDS:10 [Paraglomus occultum]